MGFVQGRSQYNWDHGIPCKNPQCKSYGRPHPNCMCTSAGIHTGTLGAGPAGPSKSVTDQYAEGGQVRFCSESRAHDRSCAYYAEGGPVMQSQPAPLDNGDTDQPNQTLGHVAIEHGLLGLLDGAIGDPVMNHPEKHIQVINDAKSRYGDRLTGQALEEPKEEGHRLGDAFFNGDSAKAAEVIQGHPLVGSAGKGTLAPILARLARPILEKEADPEALRGSVDYLHSAVRGSDKLDHELESLMEPGKPLTHMQESSREAARNELVDRIKELHARPDKLLDLSGSLGHYLPTHAGTLGATAAQALSYLNSIKPNGVQATPMDEVSEPDPIALDRYHRQLDIANHPLSILEHIKDGTLQPQDMQTVQAIYPGLHQTLVNKIGEQLIKAKSEDKEISYPHKIALSIALGQPLDSTMTSQAMQAIIHCMPTAQPSPGAQKRREGATAQTQKTIEKVDSLYATPSQQRQISKS